MTSLSLLVAASGWPGFTCCDVTCLISSRLLQFWRSDVKLLLCNLALVTEKWRGEISLIFSNPSSKLTQFRGLVELISLQKTGFSGCQNIHSFDCHLFCILAKAKGCENLLNLSELILVLLMFAVAMLLFSIYLDVM